MRFGALENEQAALDAQLAQERTQAADLKDALTIMVNSRGWQEFVLPFLKSYKRVVVDECRSPRTRAVPGLRDYFDGQCAAYDDLIRQVYGALKESADNMIPDVEDTETFLVGD